jgi:hypothetical protein
MFLATLEMNMLKSHLSSLFDQQKEFAYASSPLPLWCIKAGAFENYVMN